jgi:hypothetical protein
MLSAHRAGLYLRQLAKRQNIPWDSNACRLLPIPIVFQDLYIDETISLVDFPNISFNANNRILKNTNQLFLYLNNKHTWVEESFINNGKLLLNTEMTTLGFDKTVQRDRWMQSSISDLLKLNIAFKEPEVVLPEMNGNGKRLVCPGAPKKRKKETSVMPRKKSRLKL